MESLYSSLYSQIKDLEAKFEEKFKQLEEKYDKKVRDLEDKLEEMENEFEGKIEMLESQCIDIGQDYSTEMDTVHLEIDKEIDEIYFYKLDYLRNLKSLVFTAGGTYGSISINHSLEELTIVKAKFTNNKFKDPRDKPFLWPRGENQWDFDGFSNLKKITLINPVEGLQYFVSALIGKKNKIQTLTIEGCPSFFDCTELESYCGANNIELQIY